jgi:hypothetical protein
MRDREPYQKAAPLPGQAEWPGFAMICHPSRRKKSKCRRKRDINLGKKSPDNTLNCAIVVHIKLNVKLSFDFFSKNPGGKWKHFSLVNSSGATGSKGYPSFSFGRHSEPVAEHRHSEIRKRKRWFRAKIGAGCYAGSDARSALQAWHAGGGKEPDWPFAARRGVLTFRSLRTRRCPCRPVP